MYVYTYVCYLCFTHFEENSSISMFLVSINHFLTGDGNILEGNEMMRYVEPFSASPDDPKHPMLVLVYRQPGRVEFEEYQRGCSPSIGSSRYNQSIEMIINTL